VSVGRVVERVGLELDPDEGQQAVGLPIPGPADLVAPSGVVPPQGFRRVGGGQGLEESGLEPLATLAEEEAGPVEPDAVDESPEGPAGEVPGGRGAQRERRPPDQQVLPHVLPASGGRSSLANGLIIEGPRGDGQDGT